DLVLGLLEVLHLDLVLVAAGGDQRRLVDQELEVSTRESRSTAREDLEVDAAERDLARVDLEDADAAAQIGPGDHDAAVEAPGAQQRRVEHVRPVGRGDDDHAVVGLEAIHLDEKLVQGLLALVVTAAQAGAAVAPDRVDLVDEDDAGRVLLALLEEIADARGADADEHLDEIRPRDREERHAGFTGDGARQQRLAGTRRAHHEKALGDTAAEPGELLRILEEGDDLLDPGHILERDLVLVIGQELGLRLAEAHRLAAARLQLAHEEEEDDEQEQHRQPGDDERLPEGALLLGPDAPFDLLLVERDRDVVAGAGIRAENLGLGAAGLVGDDVTGVVTALRLDLDLLDVLRLVVARQLGLQPG